MLGKRAATHLRVEIWESLSTAARAITPDMSSPSLVRLLSAKLQARVKHEWVQTHVEVQSVILPNISHTLGNKAHGAAHTPA